MHRLRFLIRNRPSTWEVWKISNARKLRIGRVDENSRFLIEVCDNARRRPNFYRSVRRYGEFVHEFWLDLRLQQRIGHYHARLRDDKKLDVVAKDRELFLLPVDYVIYVSKLVGQFMYKYEGG